MKINNKLEQISIQEVLLSSGIQTSQELFSGLKDYQKVNSSISEETIKQARIKVDKEIKGFVQYLMFEKGRN